VLLASLALLLACAGCGFKGPLYLPEHNATVVTHPAQPSQGGAAAQTQTPGTRSKGKPSPQQNPPASPPQ
jgi:predicted small lipoprotein YifL